MKNTEIHMTFYNTISLQGEDLEKAKEDCKKQEDRIYLLFRMNEKMNPTMINWLSVKVFDEPILRASLSRSLTNLVKSGKIIKTNDLVPGPYGKPEHVWRLA